MGSRLALLSHLQLFYKLSYLVLGVFLAKKAIKFDAAKVRRLPTYKCRKLGLSNKDYLVVWCVVTIGER